MKQETFEKAQRLKKSIDDTHGDLEFMNYLHLKVSEENYASDGEGDITVGDYMDGGGFTINHEKYPDLYKKLVEIIAIETANEHKRLTEEFDNLQDGQSE